MRVLLVLVVALSGVCVVRGAIPVADPSYVVQIHASRDGFTPPTDAREQLRTQLMTTESGQRFECFLPLSPLQAQQQALEQATTRHIVDAAARESESDIAAKENDKFLAFARAAVKKIRPMCVQYTDVVDRWVYEICPGVLIRKVNLRRRSKKQTPDTSKAEDALVETTTDAKPKPEKEKVHKVQELAAFASDDETKSPMPYEEFTNGNMQTRVSSYTKPLYTQVFRARGKSNGQVGDIQIQFLCSASARDDYVAAVQWHHEDDENTKEPAAFVVASRLFCNPKHSDLDEKFSVGSLLQPMVDLHTCIKRNEGWWTYEFCFGHGIRQYHRENDGKITAEFSLGVYNAEQNEALDASGASLVTEHLDATHDSARPAFMELFTDGTHCKEFGVSTPRQSRVYYYCSQGSANHHIVSIKETQTCTYTIKISSPVVCDHPHFITEERKTEDKAEVVHCIPVATHEDLVPETTTATRSPAAAPERSDVREVEVGAT